MRRILISRLVWWRLENFVPVVIWLFKPLKPWFFRLTLMGRRSSFLVGVLTSLTRRRSRRSLLGEGRGLPRRRRFLALRLSVLWLRCSPFMPIGRRSVRVRSNF